MEGIRDEKGRLVFKADPETFLKMANRLAEGWRYKAIAQETEQKYPIMMKKLHESENNT